MQNYHLPHISTASAFHGIAWVFLVVVVGQLVVSFVVLVLGDPSKPPFDRWASWVACHMAGANDLPFVRPGAEPTLGQKIGAGVFTVLGMGLMAWFSHLFFSVR